MLLYFFYTTLSLIVIFSFYNSYRTFKSWRTNKENKFAQVFTYSNFTFTLLIVLIWIVYVGQIFTKEILLFSLSLMVLGSAFTAYTLFLLKIPNINPRFGFIFILILGLIITVLFFSFPWEGVTVKEGGGINLNLHPLVSVLTFVLFLITFFPLSIILFQKSRDFKDRTMKYKTLGLSAFLFLTFLLVFFRFAVEPFFEIKSAVSEIALGVVSFILIFVFLITQRYYNKKN